MFRRWLLVSGAVVGFVSVSTDFSWAADAGPSSAATAASLPVTSSATSSRIAESPAKAAPAPLSEKELRDEVAASLRRANSATGNGIAAAVHSLVDVYGELGRDVLLPAKDRVRLGLQVRVRLQRYASQFRYEMAHNYSNGASGAVGQSSVGSPGPAAAAGLNDLAELIQSTVGQPDDWVAIQQRALQQPGNGQAIAGGIGAGVGKAGAAHGGAFGGNDQLQNAAAANGADLVDLIQQTIDPPSWEVNGGVGTIMYFNNLHVLVVRQTGEAQDDVGGLLGGLRK